MTPVNQPSDRVADVGAGLRQMWEAGSRNGRGRLANSCAVASGRLHGYVTLGLKLWDLAPASVVLQAAGGVVTDGFGASWMHSADGSCIASNATIHGRLVTSFGPLNALRKMKADRVGT